MRLRFDPAVAFFFEFKGQFGPAGAHDSAVDQDVHKVGHDVVEQALVVGYDDHGPIG